MNHTTQHINSLVEEKFLDFIEGRPMQLDLDEVTLIMAKFTAKFAEYAATTADD